MKTQIEFTTFYNLLTQLVSEIYPDESVQEIAERLDSEVKSDKDDLMALMAHLYTDTISTIQEMERFRSDLYIAVLLRLIGALKDMNDSQCRSVENYARHIVGLDKMVIEIEEGIATKVGFVYECSNDDSVRIELLLDACEVVRRRKQFFSKYDDSNIDRLVDQLSKVKDQLENKKTFDPVEEAIRIIKSHSAN
jgi:hypothetical protein